MKWQILGAASLLTVLLTSIGLGQCRRGERQSTSPSAEAYYGSQYTQHSLSSPFNRTAQQSRQSFQQRLLAQQATYRHALEQRLRGTATQSTRQRRRQQNAERAFELAAKAEAKGRLESAEKYYRRAIGIAGKDSSLGKRAEAAIAGITPVTPADVDESSLTVLASIEK